MDQLRLTNLTLSCSAGEEQVCDPIDKVFQANGGTTDPTALFNMPLTNAYFYGFRFRWRHRSLCIADAGHICTSNTIGTTISNSLEITDVAPEPGGFLLD